MTERAERLDSVYDCPTAAPRVLAVKATLITAAIAAAGCGSAERAAPPTVAENAGDVTWERLLAADREPGNWFTTGRDFGKSHHSPLSAINTENIRDLGFAWHYWTGTNRGLEATPIVVDGIMYTSGVAGRVYALDAATGAELWTFDPKVDMQVNLYVCCDQVNRGVAVWRGKVYVGSLDGRLFALDARDGHVIWSKDTIVDHGRGYSITGAPTIAGKVVVIGNSGAEFDVRGYISAYDLETGELAWRFFTVPAEPSKPYEHPELEMAAKTWDPRSRWDIGGGGTAWDAMVYDPELDLLYVGTGNGDPQNYYVRSPTGGENLFLTSILALDPDDGRLIWYLQQVPGDAWDYTATQPMILADLEWEGENRKVLMQAPKNGYFYVIDRRTGELLSAKPYVPVNWARRIEAKTGRAIVNAELADYSKGPKLIFPSGQGGHNWNPMAYNPDTGLVYIPAIEVGEYRFNPVDPLALDYRRKSRNMGVGAVFSGRLEAALPRLPPDVRRTILSGRLQKGQPDTRERAVLKAWDPVAGHVVWEQESPGGSWDHAGVLSTAGNLVFQGTGTGYLRAYDARTGELLHEIDVGTSIIAAPMTYTVNGEQYVAVMAGWGGASWFYHRENSAAAKYGNAGRILAFKLGGGATPKPDPLPPLPPIPEPPPLNADEETIALGARLFARFCGSCHGDVPRTGSADLRRMAPATHSMFKDIVLGGQRVPLGMPRFDGVLSEGEVNAIHAFVISNAWKAYREQQGHQASTTGAGPLGTH